jgi:predicted DNA repair protein MutK
MASSSLFALIDDIATLLDDVALMSKVAVKKTAGVLGDDLALNAQQVAGVHADRELPVVWAVAKGSLVNKAILVPVALLISGFVPVLITPLLMLGGLFLCFEGAEKVLHLLTHQGTSAAQHHEELRQAVADEAVDMLAFEKDKIKGAVRTDFILSAEIIVITLGTLAEASMAQRITVLVGISIAMTVGVYGLVAAIVKLDDAGLYLSRQVARWKQAIGAALVWAAPWLMKSLSVVGTVAMFLVGGGILVHGVPWVGHGIEELSATLGWAGPLVGIGLEGAAGLLSGAAVVALLWTARRVRKAMGPSAA